MIIGIMNQGVVQHHFSPFSNKPLENIVIDELHLILRITDRLEEGLIIDIANWEEVIIKKHLTLKS